jgi:6-phosphofructokinase 2
MPALAPIVTLTLNPSVDVSYDIERLVEDQKVHARAYRYDPGGNGINVARALGRLGVPAHACFVAAGEVGELLERLVAKDIAHPHCLHVAGETRINVTLEQAEPRAQYEIIGVGPQVPASILARITHELIELAGAGYVVLTGSVPPGVPAEIYATLARELRQRGARVVLDMSGAALARALDAAPFMIKPNRHELEELVGRALPTLDAVREQACALQARGVAQVCVSLGAEGALLVEAGQVHHGLAPTVEVKSTVGAGDSMLAGLVAAFARGATPAQALRLGLACGSGTAAQPGTELFDASRLDALARQARIDTRPR